MEFVMQLILICVRERGLIYKVENYTSCLLRLYKCAARIELSYGLES